MALKFTGVGAPRFANAEQTAIDCMVVFPTLTPEPLPFTAVEVDPGAEHSEEIFRRCLAGEFGPVAPFEEVQPVAAARMPKLEPLPIVRRASGHKPKPAAPPPEPAKKREKREPTGPKHKPRPATKPAKRKR